MRLIDADALIEFCAERWIPLNIDAVNMQPTIQPEKTQLSKEGTTKDTTSEPPTIQTEPQWIPVSERMPKIGEYVLCYLKSRRYFGHYRVCIYRAADKYINHPYFDFNENGFPDVIAWMPLPEAYKPNK